MSGGGSKPGERRGGRQKGTPNKVTREIKALAQKHGPAAIERLAQLAVSAESETAQIAAIKELLDRGYGKATQPLTGADGGAVQVVTKLVREFVRPHDSHG